ncbi:MAG: hypothetical protein JJE25_13120 [Bacteroidia bacterium]|nr:hypothetical protein [Bacteroidia bacterium]
MLLVLTKDYESTVDLKVAYVNLPPNMLVVNKLPERLLLRLKANGYHLISLNAIEKENALNIDVMSLTGSEPGIKNISSRLLVRDFIEQLGSDVAIHTVHPDVILFNMSPSVTLKLPVKADMEMTFEKQYDSVSPLKISPDSVSVTMPLSSLGKIIWIETEKIQGDKIRSSIKKNVRLITSSGVTLNKKDVEINLEVEKFTEGALSVPVSLINVPRGLSIKIFPDHVSVKYLSALSNFDNVKPDMFTVVADAAASSSQGRDKLDVQIISSPSIVHSVTYQPMKVDFILKK